MRRLKANSLPAGEFFPKVQSESEIQKNIITILKYKNCYPIRFNSGIFKIGKRFVRAYILWNGKSKGLPDIQFIHRGLVHYIEVKKVGGKTSQDQDDFIAEMNGINVPVIVSDSWEKVLDYVNELP